MQPRGSDWVKDGYAATALEDEIKIPGLTVQQLLEQGAGLGRVAAAQLHHLGVVGDPIDDVSVSPDGSTVVFAAAVPEEHDLKFTDENVDPIDLDEQVDLVAYVRFASVYRQFEDVNAFREEIEKLENQPTPEARRQQMDLLDEEK